MADTPCRLYSSNKEPLTVDAMAELRITTSEVEEQAEDQREPQSKLESIVLPIVQYYESILYVGAAPATYLIQYPLNKYKIVSYDTFVPAYVSKSKLGVKHYKKYFTLSEVQHVKDIRAVVIDAEDTSSADQSSEQRREKHDEYLRWIIALESRGVEFYSVKWRPRASDVSAFEGMMVPSEAQFVLQAYNGMDSFETRMEGPLPITDWVPFDLESYVANVSKYNTMRKLAPKTNENQYENLMTRFAIHGNYLITACSERTVLSTFSISNAFNSIQDVGTFLKHKNWAVTYPMTETPNGVIGESKYMNDEKQILTTQTNGKTYTDNTMLDPRMFDAVSTQATRVTTLSEFLPFMEGSFPGVDFATRGTYVVSNFSFPQQQLNQCPTATLAPYVKEYSGMLRGSTMIDTFEYYKPRYEQAPGIKIPSKFFTYATNTELSKTGGHILNLLMMGNYYVMPVERYVRAAFRQDEKYYTYGEDVSTVEFHTKTEIDDAYDVYARLMNDLGKPRKYSKRYLNRNMWTSKLTTLVFNDVSELSLASKDDYLKVAMILGDLDYMNQPSTLKVKLVKIIDWMLFDICVNRQVIGLSKEQLSNITSYRIGE